MQGGGENVVNKFPLSISHFHCNTFTFTLSLWPKEIWNWMQGGGENVANKFPPTALSRSNSETLLHRLLVTVGKILTKSANDNKKSNFWQTNIFPQRLFG